MNFIIVEWVMVELLCNLEVMVNVKVEINFIVGLNWYVCDFDFL